MAARVGARIRTRIGRRRPAGAEIPPVIVDCAHYRGGERQHEEPLEIETAAAVAAAASDGEFVWLGLRDPSPDELERAQSAFGLNPLAVEDARHAHQRPKLEDYDGSVFLVLRTVRYVDET